MKKTEAAIIQNNLVMPFNMVGSINPIMALMFKSPNLWHDLAHAIGKNMPSNIVSKELNKLLVDEPFEPLSKNQKVADLQRVGRVIKILEVAFRDIENQVNPREVNER